MSDLTYPYDESGSQHTPPPPLTSVTNHPIILFLSEAGSFKKQKQKRQKILGINLTKKVQHLHTGNYKILLREIKEDLNKQRHLTFMDQKT